jgi:hypothetical protein
MTPRRILLLVGGLVAFAAAYFGYARFIGWLDGLPLLPPKMLIASQGSFVLPERPTSPTIEMLKVAFGDGSPELDPVNYPTQLEFRRSPETSVVVASGSPPSNPNSTRVPLTPFSVAVFRKPRPDHVLEPGEISEISTIHADRGVLEFDRIITTPSDMNTAKLVRLELISDPEQAVPDAFHREGRVHITNNQRGSDSNRYIVLRTIGPVFYVDQKAAANAAGTPKQLGLGPDIWTDAFVEIVDRGNLPRRPGVAAATAPAAGEDVRNAEAVSEVLNWQRLPPPTLTAVGLRVYLDSNNPEGNATPKQPNDSSGFSGVRRVEFLEKVLMNLWVEGGQALVGSSGKPGAIPEAQPVAIATIGGFVCGVNAARELSRELLQVETRGPFFYDAEKNLAHFEVLPLADPNLTNDVRVTKVPARPGTQTLFSQVLELEFHGANEPPPPPKPGQPDPPEAATGQPGQPQIGGRFKRLHAWTVTPGRFLTVSSDADQMEAYGQDLIYEPSPERTQLSGAPFYAIQQRNVLSAGGPKEVGVMIIEPAPVDPKAPPEVKPSGPPGGPGSERRVVVTVHGAGRVELYDAAANATSLTASWQTSLVQTKERVNDQELDLFTFNDDAKFVDVRADYWLKAKLIKLWVTQPPHSEDAPPASPGTQPVSRGLPRRLQAVGDVSGHSADLDIEHSELLNTYIRDTAPPTELVGPVDPLQNPASTKPANSQTTPGAGPQQPKDPADPARPQAPVAPGDPAAVPPEPEKPKPPTKIRARTIDTYVRRYPTLKVPAAPTPVASKTVPSAQPKPPADDQTGGMKYEMENARCEGMVTVHQDPADATKPRGTDILGSLMLIDSTPEGNVMTVFGWDNRPGEVHNEGTSLIGPKVLIDQLHNLVVIEGRGSLVMPASSDLSGAELKEPESVVVHFRDGMKFRGALKLAEFFGKVNASQGQSWIACHTMQVNFDRPVYFTQTNRPGTPAKPATPKPASAPMPIPMRPPAKGPNGASAPNAAADDDKPKIDVVYCYPAPADSADSPQEKQVYFSQVDRDPDTGKVIHRQSLVARELTMRAQVRDPGGSEPYRFVMAEGPGIVRNWQMGSKDDDPGVGGSGPALVSAAPKQPNNAAAQQPAEGEMKLTVVSFAGRMTAKDKGPVYQSATFLDSVQAIQVPTENPDLAVDQHKPLPRAMMLNCKDQLVVWTHKKGNDPPEQHMAATGNAEMQNEEYDGWGDIITVDGKIVTLEGVGAVYARIKSRFKGNDQAGRKIVFDRSTNYLKVEGSLGSTITGPPAAAPKPPPKDGDNSPTNPMSPMPMQKGPVPTSLPITRKP